MDAIEFKFATDQFLQDSGRALFDLLRSKWRTVPAGLNGRARTSSVSKLPDRELIEFWDGVHSESVTGRGYSTRGWYQELYKDVFKGKRVLEIGSGLGIDGIYFASKGAHWHFADIVEGNLKLLKRIMALKGVEADGFTYLDDLNALDGISGQFDFIYCQGSMINTPLGVAEYETLRILSKLKEGGRWIELCYPEERWQREGKLPFSEWGVVTDGPGTPWVEWYDEEKLHRRFSPVSLKTNLAFNFHNDEFNWFDFTVSQIPYSLLDDPVSLKKQEQSVPLSTEDYRLFLHNCSKAETVENVIEITTPSEIWNYAAQFDFNVNDHVKIDNPEEANVLLEVRIKALEGSVGVGLLDENLKEYLLPERVVHKSEMETRIVLPLEKTEATCRLMIRQVDGGNQASKAQLLGLKIRTANTLKGETENGFGNSVSILDLGETLRSLPIELLSKETAELLESRDLEDYQPVFLRVTSPETFLETLSGNANNTFESFTQTRVTEWTMEENDSKILAPIYQFLKPQHHLEFGTWKGFGTCLVAENSDAHIHTINLADGEKDKNGKPVYGSSDSSGKFIQSDTSENVGMLYKDRGYSDRVTQILRDSMLWTAEEYMTAFFDTILIDGGHSVEIVKNDTEKALPLLKSGGLMIWHDFCPTKDALEHSSATRGVVQAIHNNWHQWSQHFEKLVWIKPSYLLVGTKR